MRVIAGIHRHRQIKAPVGRETTRPITDRVKQSLFDRIASAGALEGNALDIFAGSGAIGIEALSRGVEHCTFIERHRGVRRVLDGNLELLGLMPQSVVIAVDALSVSWISLLPRQPLSLIFCDPPYVLTNDANTMLKIVELIEALGAVTEQHGLLSLRTEHCAQVLPAQGWDTPETYRYGSQFLHFYWKL